MEVSKIPLLSPVDLQDDELLSIWPNRIVDITKYKEDKFGY